MSDESYSATLEIQNRKGLHARAAAAFVKAIEDLNAEVSVERIGQTVSGCSIMGLMMLAAAKGTTIQVTCKGPQAKEAMDALTLLVNSKFGEDYVLMKAKAPRNKTLELNTTQTNSYAAQAVKLKTNAELSEIQDRIIWQDALKAIDFLPEKSVDLMIVDPPYNLTKNFGKSTFKERENSVYQQSFDEWLSKTVRLLKDNASIYICADWKTSIAIPEIAGKYFLLQNRISWEREKGRGASNNWKNCLEDIWFFTKSKDYTFNLEAVKVQRRVIAPYRDKSGLPKDWVQNDDERYRLTAPSNIWTDISIPFWSMPENTPHPTQKPEKLIAKLILASSNPGDLIFDPFVGSGTTAVTAKKLGRHYVGIEREKEYVALALKRLELAEENREIQGYENGIFRARNG